MILFDLEQKYGRDSQYAIRTSPDAFCLITKGILEYLDHEVLYSVFLYEQLHIHFRMDYSRRLVSFEMFGKRYPEGS